jgi:hypothetical protein
MELMYKGRRIVVDHRPGTDLKSLHIDDRPAPVPETTSAGELIQMAKDMIDGRVSTGSDRRAM